MGCILRVTTESRLESIFLIIFDLFIPYHSILHYILELCNSCRSLAIVLMTSCAGVYHWVLGIT